MPDCHKCQRSRYGSGAVPSVDPPATRTGGRRANDGTENFPMRMTRLLTGAGVAGGGGPGAADELHPGQLLHRGGDRARPLQPGVPDPADVGRPGRRADQRQGRGRRQLPEVDRLPGDDLPQRQRDRLHHERLRRAAVLRAPRVQGQRVQRVGVLAGPGPEPRRRGRLDRHDHRHQPQPELVAVVPDELPVVGDAQLHDRGDVQRPDGHLGRLGDDPAERRTHRRPGAGRTGGSGRPTLSWRAAPRSAPPRHRCARAPPPRR
jgi:hypothetical protein